VQSLFDQTFADFEVILVDDGGPDRTGELCDKLAAADERVRVIHQENRGLGGARNTGIEAARGTWLLLVDSDDWIEPEILEKALKAAERENADMVSFGFRSVDLQGKELGLFRDKLPKNRALSLADCKALLLSSPCAWNKLYKTSLFQHSGVRYPLRVWYEDIRTTLKLLLFAERVVSLDDIGYNYFQRFGSTMRNSNLDRNAEILDTFDAILTYFREKGLFEEYREELCFLTYSHLYQAAVRVVRAYRSHPLLPRLQSYLTEHFPDYRKNSYMRTLPKKQKLVSFVLGDHL